MNKKNFFFFYSMSPTPSHKVVTSISCIQHLSHEDSYLDTVSLWNWQCFLHLWVMHQVVPTHLQHPAQWCIPKSWYLYFPLPLQDRCLPEIEEKSSKLVFAIFQRCAQKIFPCEFIYCCLHYTWLWVRVFPPMQSLWVYRYNRDHYIKQSQSPYWYGDWSMKMGSWWFGVQI